MSDSTPSASDRLDVTDSELSTADIDRLADIVGALDEAGVFVTSVELGSGNALPRGGTVTFEFAEE
jgi:hypothetical protein